MPHCLGVIDGLKNNRQTNQTAVETKNRVLLSMKGRLSVYKKKSVRWPESEGTGKVTRYHEVSEESEIQMLLIPN